MAFFKRSEKALASQRGFQSLRRDYERTEQALETAAKRGVKKAMKEHHKYEYALLYKNMKNK